MKITIDKNSGYCFGVEYAIAMAEEELNENSSLYCLGDIVHNDKEVARLSAKGLKIINREDLKQLSDCKVLIRAHGEPPETYQIALKNNIELIDASCPVVLKLQNRIKNAYDNAKQHNGQIVIYGKKGHAEVIGLSGQTNEEAIIVTDEKDLENLDYSKPITFFSQTTKSTEGFYKMKDLIEKNIQEKGFSDNLALFDANDSICRQVANREPQLAKFAQENDVIVFVSGKKSSNGKSLFAVCQKANPRSYFVEDEKELQPEWFENCESIGICGATSTPMWLMENVKKEIETQMCLLPQDL
ncbi:4-hydroxy-3-methylbut-2-enyl diphosphate reductase [Raineya orbicola]|uniref:4-hydroxy-3-methylbut-2-enyl diphosphate reductase n=1 Tax=Raineya orbicola TaxID=2016530 RepID=A0A2N3IF52_9BACT|nr:4-hydroxy-3-methylbut-2-enyl diphosphate reductase [Raineya orbicola]PKQ68940.1 4-hydroxy-3-methylbut-2-enyl diphosphate reductase [Raineya orbicola]